MLTRRWLTPVYAVVGFAVVAALVAGGLGWVTVESLQVEAAEREATARADAAARERLALWRLDARLFPSLGVESNRPYSHYFALSLQPAMVLNDAGEQVGPARVPSPLLSAELPDWMPLHFQLDPATGWESPQVPDPAVLGMFDGQPAFRNATPDRRELLDRLRRQLPARDLYDLLVRLEAADPTDGPQAVPVTNPLNQMVIDAPQPTEPAAISAAKKSAADEFRGFPAQPTPADPARKLEAAQPAPQPSAPRYAAAPQKGAEAYQHNEYQARRDTLNNATRGQSPNPPAGPPPGPPAAEPTPTPPAGSAGGGFGGTRGASPPADRPTAKDADRLTADRKRQAGKGDELDKAGDKREPLAEKEAKEDAAVRAAAAKAKQAAPRGEPVDRAKAALGRPPAVLRPPAVHLGPVRPHWLPSTDGTPVLALVRAARLETKTVFQGVILDWPKLRQTLTDAVRDDFPAAALMPAVDPDEGGERRMAGVPAVLDPGPPPPPPPAGWTPLRLGLVLAWAAAVVALAAVGVGGGSLLALSERRIRFVSAVTHELRTPLTSLRLLLDLLASGLVTDEAKRREYLDTLSGESDRLNRLIENVLDFARLEKRSVRLHRQPTPVADLLDDARRTWADRLAADGKELVVVSTVPPDQSVNTDPRVAGQVLCNLIDNARKYSRGSADPRVWVWAKPGDGRRVVFEVEDRGPGVPAGERRRVFRPFRRGPDADTTAGGAGLGLALAKQWADMLGGSLVCRAAAGGVGACFRLELPAG